MFRFGFGVFDMFEGLEGKGEVDDEGYCADGWENSVDGFILLLLLLLMLGLYEVE
jgi:hypothetical protein